MNFHYMNLERERINTKFNFILFKVNKYTMWVKEVEGVYIPVHYEMKGYNNLLGSHYDHYYVSYDNFSPEVSFWLFISFEIRTLEYLN